VTKNAVKAALRNTPGAHIDQRVAVVGYGAEIPVPIALEDGKPLSASKLSYSRGKVWRRLNGEARSTGYTVWCVRSMVATLTAIAKLGEARDWTVGLAFANQPSLILTFALVDATMQSFNRDSWCSG
jgi:hypothetical protein